MMAPELDARLVIIGSGAAGTAAALALAEQGEVPLMLDVGQQRTNVLPEMSGNFYDHAEQHDVHQAILGDDYHGLYNLNPANPHVSVVLTLPKYQHVLSQAAALQPVEQAGSSVVQSVARGGLADAWGAAAYRYLDRDLRDYPIRARDLDPYYDVLTREMGINGADDDLTPFYGSTRYLQPPLRMPRNSSCVLQRYRRRRRGLNRRGFYLGRQRVAVLTESSRERRAYEYWNAEHFSQTTSIYTPRLTLDRLIREERLRYRAQMLVESWEREGEVIRVRGKDLRSNSSFQITCRKLLLGAGALNSARLALASRQDHTTELPLLDHTMIFIPFVLPRRLGKRLDREGYGSTVIGLACDFPEFSSPLHGPLYETMSVPRAEFYRHLPFQASFNVSLLRVLLPAMMVMFLYFPSDIVPPGRLRLTRQGKMLIQAPTEEPPWWAVRRVIHGARRLGLFSHWRLAVPVPFGGAIHAAGTLPMRARPEHPYQCDADGELAGAPGVHVIDGAALPYLPSKNHTLTIMANAMRIASQLCRRSDWECPRPKKLLSQSS